MDKLREVVRFILIAGTLVSIAMNIIDQANAGNAGNAGASEQVYLAITTIECTVVGYVFLRLIGAVK